MNRMSFKCKTCGKIFVAPSRAASIVLYNNLGISRYRVSVTCPNCGKTMSVPDNPRTRRWLSNRFRTKDFVIAEKTPIDEAVEEAMTGCGT